MNPKHSFHKFGALNCNYILLVHEQSLDASYRQTSYGPQTENIFGCKIWWPQRPLNLNTQHILRRGQWKRQWYKIQHYDMWLMSLDITHNIIVITTWYSAKSKYFQFTVLPSWETTYHILNTDYESYAVLWNCASYGIMNIREYIFLHLSVKLKLYNQLHWAVLVKQILTQLQKKFLSLCNHKVNYHVCSNPSLVSILKHTNPVKILLLYIAYIPIYT